MNGFELHNIGKLVKSLRKQRGLTQAALAEQAGIDTATLSKIENGHAMPNKNNLVSLLEKLRFDYGEALPLFLSEKETRFENIKKQIYGLTDVQDPEQAKKLNEFLIELENNTEFYEDDLNRQWAISVKASAIMRPVHAVTTAFKAKLGTSAEEHIKMREREPLPTELVVQVDNAIEKYYEALKITIPTFKIEEVKEYYLSRCELDLVAGLAVAYYAKGQKNLAITAYIDLVKGMESNYRGNAFLTDNYPRTVSNLCNLFVSDYRFEEMLEYSSRALEKCISLNLPMIPFLAFWKGIALLEILYMEHGTYDVPEVEEGKMLLLDAYHGCRLIRRVSMQKNIESLFARCFKTKMDGTPIEEV